MDFRASGPTMIGMELEFQLLDASTLDLRDGILPLMDLYLGSPHIRSEFIQNTVEVASKVCASVPELEEHLRGVVADLQEIRRRPRWPGRFTPVELIDTTLGHPARYSEPYSLRCLRQI